MKKYLKDFYNYDELVEFIEEELPVIKNWDILDEELCIRADIIKNKPYVKKLKQLFNENNLFFKNPTNEEIVTWLDSLFIIQELFLSGILDHEAVDWNINIFMEYLIPYSNFERIDYLLCYNNDVLIIECGYANDENFKEMRLRKNNELLYYKEKLNDIFRYHNLNFYTYPLIYNAYNIDETIHNLGEYINFIFLKSKYDIAYNIFKSEKKENTHKDYYIYYY